jgi:hypothetical protein
MVSRDSVRQRGQTASGANGPDVAAGKFERYLGAITPVYARDPRGCEARGREGEGSPRTKKAEAMYFFSESHMR